MLFDGVIYDEELLRRFYSGEELELVGAFSEGVYFNGPRGIVLIHDSQYGSLRDRRESFFRLGTGTWPYAWE